MMVNNGYAVGVVGCKFMLDAIGYILLLVDAFLVQMLCRDDTIINESFVFCISTLSKFIVSFQNLRILLFLIIGMVIEFFCL